MCARERLCIGKTQSLFVSRTFLFLPVLRPFLSSIPAEKETCATSIQFLVISSFFFTSLTHSRISVPFFLSHSRCCCNGANMYNRFNMAYRIRYNLIKEQETNKHFFVFYIFSSALYIRFFNGFSFIFRSFLLNASSIHFNSRKNKHFIWLKVVDYMV